MYTFVMYCFILSPLCYYHYVKNYGCGYLSLLLIMEWRVCSPVQVRECRHGHLPLCCAQKEDEEEGEASIMEVIKKTAFLSPRNPKGSREDSLLGESVTTTFNREHPTGCTLG